MKKNKLELKFSTQRKLSKKEKRKAFHVRRKGKKVQQRSFEHGQAVRKNMTFYWDNVLIETRNVFPFNEVMSYIELDQRRKPRQVKVDISTLHEGRLEGRSISEREVEDTVQLGLQVDDVVTDGDKVFFNKYFYRDDLCVVGTAHKGSVNVRTAYRITDIGDVGFLKKSVEWLRRPLAARNKVARFYVVDRTTSEIYAQDPVVQALVFITTLAERMPGGKLKDGPLTKAMKKMLARNKKLEKKLNLIPWDSKTDMGTTFNPNPRHDYSFVVEIDKPESGKLDDLTKLFLKNSGLDVDKYSNKMMTLPDLDSDTAVIMFDLRDFSGDEHFWAQ
tara:strand:+ start:80 stop:1075 length:996 start_codon:yes stop_codon:yes gene_type:complete